MSPRTPKANQQIRAERKEEILNAAIKVFTHKGYAATKISDIAAAAEVSHGLVYHYFQSKEEVYGELADRLSQGASSLRLFVDGPGTPREKVHKMLAMMLGTVRSNPEFYVLAIQAISTEGVAPAAAEKVFKEGMAGQEAMARVIAEGQAAGAFKPGDPKQHFALLYAVINGLAIAFTFSRYTRQAPLEVDADTVLRLIEP